MTMTQKITSPAKQRVQELMERFAALSAELHVTTLEMLIVSQHLMAVAVAQTVSDNPQTDRRQLVNGTLDILRRRLTDAARGMTIVGEA